MNMSNAGEEKTREGEQKSKNKSNPEDYCRAVTKVAVAQVCEGVRLEGVKQSALEALSDIAIRYICDLGKSAKHYAGLAGRSECNVFDIVKALEDLSSTRGFSSASEFDCCAIDSGALKEIVDFVATAEEIPFAQPIPHFPVSKSTTPKQIFSQLDQTPSGKNVPEWLPAFPDPHTYQNSPVLIKRQENSQAEIAEEARQRKKAETALLRLQHRLVSSTSAGPATNPADGLEETGAPEQNPFLAPPLLAGEKEVSQIVVPSSLVNTAANKKHGPLVETFALAIDAKKGREEDSMDVDKGLSLDKRPIVHFRLRTGKKMLSENVDVSLRSNRGGEGRLPALSIDEKRDEKKRRAEQILKQSMMNPQETSENAK